ncbi:MAG TPA: hypothetical protein VNS46_12240 [Nocardioides sp.]|nr:hypothetical protein [Nocardioides sp.]
MSADRVRGVMAAFLTGAKKAYDPELPADLDLYGGGLELDSLEAAELSAMLEDEFGTDPFSAGDEMPETVGEVLAFYEAAATA